jgi:MFS family permease
MRRFIAEKQFHTDLTFNVWGFVISISYSAIILVAHLVDRIGFNLFWMLGSSFSVFLVMLVVLFSPVVPLWFVMIVVITGIITGVLSALCLMPFLLRRRTWAQGYSWIVVSLAAGSDLAGILLLIFATEQELLVWLSFASACAALITIILLLVFDWQYSFILSRSSRVWHEVLWDPLGERSSI